MSVECLNYLHPGGVILASSIFSARVAYAYYETMPVDFGMEHVLELAKRMTDTDPPYQFHPAGIEQHGWRKDALWYPRLSRTIPLRFHWVENGSSPKIKEAMDRLDKAPIDLDEETCKALEEASIIFENPMSREMYAELTPVLKEKKLFEKVSRGLKDSSWTYLMHELPDHEISQVFKKYPAPDIEELEELLKTKRSDEKAWAVHDFFIEKKPLVRGNGRVGRWLLFKLLESEKKPTFFSSIQYRNRSQDDAVKWQEKLAEGNLPDALIEFVKCYKRCTFADLFFIFFSQDIDIDGDDNILDIDGNIVWPDVDGKIVAMFNTLCGPEGPLKYQKAYIQEYIITGTSPANSKAWHPHVIVPRT